jgi:acetate kinase
MEGADAIIFSGGIGENSPTIRALICGPMSWMGLALDDSRNNEFLSGKEGLISGENSKVKIAVIPTNEELLIARDTVRLIGGA